MKHRIYTSKTYRQLPINQNYHLIESYLNSIHNTLNNALTQHPRTIIYNAILRLPQEAGGINYDNVISRFLESFKPILKATLKRRERNGKRVHDTTLRYVWCRERDSSCNDHFHIFFLLNGDTYQKWGSFNNPKEGEMFFMITEAWARAVGILASRNNGLVDVRSQPKTINTKLIRTESELDQFSGLMLNSYESTFHWMSYIAKLDTKNYGDNRRNFGCSQNKVTTGILQRSRM
jgi:hypothetical protein